MSDSVDSASCIIVAVLFFTSVFSFSLILSDTFLSPSLPLARSPAGLPEPTGVAVVSFAARALVALVAGAV